MCSTFPRSNRLQFCLSYHVFTCKVVLYICLECSIVETLEAATLHPAQLLGEESDIGTLNFGSRADFVLLDSSLEVQRTYIGGQCVYDRESK